MSFFIDRQSLAIPTLPTLSIFIKNRTFHLPQPIQITLIEKRHEKKSLQNFVYKINLFIFAKRARVRRNNSSFFINL